MKAKVVSFHTPDKRYSHYAAKLKASCREHEVPFVVTQLAGMDTWVETVSMKPAVMLSVMKILARPIVWIDVDATVKAPLDLLNDCEYDVAIHTKNRRRRKWKAVGRHDILTLPAKWPKDDTRWFLTGTVFVNATAGGMGFLRDWKARAEANRRGYQQLICQEAWCATKPKTLWLPDSYCAIFGRSSEPAVIQHELASCRRPKNDPAVRS